MASDILHYGILSTGNIARQFTRDLAGAKHSRAVAVASRSAASAAAFAQDFGIDAPKAYGSYDALLADAGVQAVYIGLPNSLHREWTLKALAVGKHVLCEKPIAANAAEAEEMFDAADRAGLLLMEAFMYRFTPLMRKVEQVITSGTIGDVQLVRSSFCYAMHRWEGNIRFNAELAGGALMDIGCYCINFARHIARVVNEGANAAEDVEPAEMHASGNLHESGIDNLTVGTLAFDLADRRRLVSDFVCGMSTQSNNMAIVSGSQGFIEIPIPWKPPQTAAKYTVDFQTPPQLAGGGAKPQRQEHSVDSDTPLFALEADAFAAAVFGGDTSGLITRSDSVGNMRVLDELRRQVGTN